MTESQLRGIIVALTASLAALLTAWYGILSPPKTLPFWLPLLFLLPLLLFALPGMLKARRKTYKWFTMAVLFYWTHGIMEWVSSPEDRLYAGIEVGISLLLFWLCVYYVRWSDAARIQQQQH